jgi:hypothetical protein
VCSNVIGGAFAINSSELGRCWFVLNL